LVDLRLTVVQNHVRFYRIHFIFDKLDFFGDLRKDFYRSVDPVLNVMFFSPLDFSKVLNFYRGVDRGA
jgi:hypothetical protein